jgi:hypothetical protein
VAASESAKFPTERLAAFDLGLEELELLLVVEALLAVVVVAGSTGTSVELTTAAVGGAGAAAWPFSTVKYMPCKVLNFIKKRQDFLTGQMLSKRTATGCPSFAF